MSTTHDELVARALRWLRNSMGCVVVVSEFTNLIEHPDALGWRGTGHSLLVECKASRADFRRDRNKCTRNPLITDLGLGAERWYFTPKGLLQPDELPPGWFLAEVWGKTVRCITRPDPRLPVDQRGTSLHREMVLLVSLAKRALGVLGEAERSLRP